MLVAVIGVVRLIVGNDGTNVYSGYDGQGGGSGSTLYYPDIVVELNKNVVYIDDEVFRTFTASTFQVNYNLYLFTQNRAGTALTPTGSRTTTTSLIQCEYCKIWDNGTLVRDFVPALRQSDNALGLYDKVNDVFYGNAGSGSFTTYESVEDITGAWLYELKYGDTQIWDGDLFIANASGVNANLVVYITVSGPTTLMFNSEVHTVSSSGKVTFSNSADITDDLIVYGHFSDIYIPTDNNDKGIQKTLGAINYVKKMV